MCDARALPPKTQSNHPKPRNATSPNNSKIISSQPAPLTVTHPSIPSQEGNPHATNHSLPKRNKHHKPPLSRGVGGVSRLCTATEKQKRSPKAKKHDLTKQQQKHLHPCRASHRHTPLNPLSRGETDTPPITHY